MIVECAYEVSSYTYLRDSGGHVRSEPRVSGCCSRNTLHSSHPHHCQIRFNYNTLHCTDICVCARRPTHVASALCNIRSIAALRFSGGEWKAIVICDPHTPVKRQIPKTKSHSI